MRNLFLAFLIISNPFLSLVSNAQDSNSLTQAKTIFCNFPRGTTGFLMKNEYDIKNATDSNMSYVFDSIDLHAKKGRLIGNLGASDVFVFSDPSSLTLIESTANGGMIYTTIFNKVDQTGAYYATTSRHLNIQGQPLTSQWYGKCQVTDFQ